MKYFIALRHNKHTRPGQWWMSEEVGDPCFQCRVAEGPEGTKFIQTSHIAIPFDVLADVLVEHNFQIPMKAAANREKAFTSSRGIIQEQEDFYRENEEIIEDEFMRKKQREFPSFKGKGVFINREKGSKQGSD